MYSQSPCTVKNCLQDLSRLLLLTYWRANFPLGAATSSTVASRLQIHPVKKGLRANCRKGYYASASVEAMKTQP